MACQIIRNDKGKITEVLAENGQPSKLFETINSLPFIADEEQAAMYYARTQLDGFKKLYGDKLVLDENGEPILVFQHLSDNRMFSYNGVELTTNFADANKEDKQGRGVSFGFLKGKMGSEISGNNPSILAEFSEAADKNQSNIISLKLNSETTKYSTPENSFLLLDTYNKNVSPKTFDGWIAQLTNLGVQLTKKERKPLNTRQDTYDGQDLDGTRIIDRDTQEEYTDTTTGDRRAEETARDIRSIQEAKRNVAIKRNNGNPLTKAPNGNPSILYQTYKDLGYTDQEAEQLVAQVYSDEFGDWFGRWWEQQTERSSSPYTINKPLIDEDGITYNAIIEILGGLENVFRIYNKSEKNNVRTLTGKYLTKDNVELSIEGEDGGDVYYQLKVKSPFGEGFTVSEEYLDKNMTKQEVFEELWAMAESYHNFPIIANNYGYTVDPSTLENMASELFVEYAEKEIIGENLFDTFYKVFSLFSEIESLRKYAEYTIKEKQLENKDSFLEIDDSNKTISINTQAFTINKVNDSELSEYAEGILGISADEYDFSNLFGTKSFIINILNEINKKEFGKELNLRYDYIIEALRENAGKLTSNQEVSKVVDENGMPMVVYHGGLKFNIFNKPNTEDKGIYFTDNIFFAQDVFALQSEIVERDKKDEYDDVPDDMLDSQKWDEKYFKYAENKKVFLNLRNPTITESIDAKLIPKNYESSKDGFIAKTTGDFGYEGGQYVVFEPNQIKSATENIGAFSTENADIRFSIIGERGAQNVTAEKNLLEEAKSLQKQGASPDVIEQRTGWFFLDNQWKKLSTQLIERFKIKPDAFNKTDVEQTLEEVLADPLLFEYYPDIKDVKVVFYTEQYLKDRRKAQESQGANIKGFFSPKEGKSGVVYINSEQSENNGASTLAHEITHVLGDIEQFPSGGSGLSVVKEAFKVAKIDDAVINQNNYLKLKEYQQNNPNNTVINNAVDIILGVYAGDNFAQARAYQLLQGEIDANIVEKVYNKIQRGEALDTTFKQEFYDYLNEYFIKEEDRIVFRDASERFSIIGERGAAQLDIMQEATFRMDNLQVAREMENSGKDAKTIRISTGWERGADGLWRYEISDGTKKEVEFRPSNKYTLLGEVVGETTLRELYNHSELYSAFPDLRQTKVFMIELKNPSPYYGFVLNNELYLNQQYYANITDRQLNHEVSHLIQNIEGFAQGANGNIFRREIQRIIDNLRGADKEGTTENRWAELIEKERVAESINNILKKAGLKETEIIDKLLEVDLEIIDYVASNLYLRTSGEVEARNVEARMSLTSEERRQILLQETEDIAREDQIFLDNNLSQLAWYQQAGEWRFSTTEQIIDRLKQTGLAENVFLLTPQEIDAKLAELGYSEDVRRQMADSIEDSNKRLVNGFYSPLEKIIAETKFDKLPAKQWIDKFAKGEEAKWTGLNDWLSKQTGSVSKSEIQNYLKENRIEIVEVVKGDVDTEIPLDGSLFSEIKTGENISNNGLFKVIKEFGEPSKIYYIGEGKEMMVNATNGLDNINWSIEEYINKPKNRQQTDNTKFSKYQLEGEKENYKEVLVTIPKKKVKVDGFEISETDTVIYEDRGMGKPLKVVKVIPKKFTEASDEASKYIRDNSYNHEYNLDYNDGESVIDALEQSGVKFDKANFQSSHFDEPNILVHLRMNTRTDAQGNKVLFLEEVQSDWGQAIKKEGSTTQLAKEKEAKQNRIKALADILKQTPDDTNAYNEFQTVSNELRALEGKQGISDAPFVTDTNAWTKLGLKVALKEAVAQGVDKIAWTTGEQQNDRYDLSKSVDYVKNSGKTPNGDTYIDISLPSGLLNLHVNNNGIVTKQLGSMNIVEAEGKRLDDIIGKDIAERILSSDTNTKLEGEGLKVGGKGMKGFYGSPTEGSLGIVGNVAKSLFKQEPKTVSLGGKKGSITRTQALSLVNDGKRVFTELRGEEYPLNTVGDVMEANNYYVKDSESSVQSAQHSIDITPELKASVEQGLPLFHKALSNAGIKPIVNGFVIGKEVFLNKEAMSPATPIHEYSHLLNSWMKQNRPDLYKKGMELVEKEMGRGEQSEIQDIINYVKQTQPSLTGESLQDEIISELTGRRGVEIINSTKKSGIKDWLLQVWEDIKNMLGILDATPEQVANMTLQEFADASAVQLLKGENIQDGLDFSTFKPNKIISGINEELVSIAENYKKTNGLPTGSPRLVLNVSEKDAMRIADAYDEMKHTPNDPTVKKGFRELIYEINRQADMLLNAGYKFEISKADRSYNSSAEMVADVINNKHIFVDPSSENFGTTREFDSENIGLQDSGYKDVNGNPMTNVEVIRAVHDIFGHAKFGTQFGAIGEENAWRTHMTMFTPLAQKALTSTTRGQNSWVNFGKHLRKDGKVIKKGESGYIAPANRPFAEQKIGFLPDWVLDNSYGDKVTIDGKEITPANKHSIMGENIYEITDGEAYFKAISQAKESRLDESIPEANRDGIQVYVKSAQEYQNIVDRGGKLLISKDGLTGVMVEADGNIGSGFNHSKNTKANSLAPYLVLGIKMGARYTDAYDTYLPKYYAKFGFKVSERMKFNPEFAEEGWQNSILKTQPDVVFMYYDGGDRATIENRIGTFTPYTKDQGEYTEDYDAGVEKAKNATPIQSSLLPLSLSEKVIIGKGAAAQELNQPVIAFSKAISNRSEFENTLKFGVWGMLTAQNPNAKELPQAENKERNKQAEIWLKNKGYAFTPIEGMYDQKEESYFVPNLTFEDAVEFAQTFEQESVATNEGLVYQDGSFNPRMMGEETIGGTYDNYYSTIKIGNKNINFQVNYDWAAPKGVKIVPQTSGNYANLTEDNQGNFVFYHVGEEGYQTIEPGTGRSLTTSSTERIALSRVGGLAMYYTRPDDAESMIGGAAKYMVKIPKSQVYDYNADVLNLEEKARARYTDKYGKEGFDTNHSLAFVTQVAQEKGFKMVVASWGDKTRAQTTESLQPSDVQISFGNAVKKHFAETYESNTAKNWTTMPRRGVAAALNEIYKEISIIRDNQGNYDSLYRLSYSNLSQDQVTDLITKSDLPIYVKAKYKAILKRDARPASSMKANPEMSLQLGKEELEDYTARKGVFNIQYPVRLFKGIFGERTSDGTPRPAHPKVKGIFTSVSQDIAKRYQAEGEQLQEFIIPSNTTLQVVNLLGVADGESLEVLRVLETNAIKNSTAQIVKLITKDAKGIEEQYIIKDRDLIDTQAAIKTSEGLGKADVSTIIEKKIQDGDITRQCKL